MASRAISMSARCCFAAAGMCAGVATMPKKNSEPASAADADLVSAIEAVVGENDDAVRIPMSALNQGIADTVAANAAIIARVSNTLTRKLNQAVTDNDNDLELIGTAILQRLNDWVAENDLLLNHLASSAGLIGPGDPLEAALLGQTTAAPDIAYSASLLMALRETQPYLGAIVEVLREIRDRMPALTEEDPGEPAAIAGSMAEADAVPQAVAPRPALPQPPPLVL